MSDIKDMYKEIKAISAQYKQIKEVFGKEQRQTTNKKQVLTVPKRSLTCCSSYPIKKYE